MLLWKKNNKIEKPLFILTKNKWRKNTWWLLSFIVILNYFIKYYSSRAWYFLIRNTMLILKKFLHSFLHSLIISKYREWCLAQNWSLEIKISGKWAPPTVIEGSKSQIKTFCSNEMSTGRQPGCAEWLPPWYQRHGYLSTALGQAEVPSTCSFP